MRLIDVICESGMSRVRGPSIVIGMALPIQCHMGVGGEREGEGFVPLPHYQSDTSPIEGCQPPKVLPGGYIPQGEINFVDVVDFSLGSM